MNQSPNLILLTPFFFFNLVKVLDKTAVLDEFEDRHVSGVEVRAKSFSLRQRYVLKGSNVSP